MLLLCLVSPLSATEQTSEEIPPSMEFLEFLGEWETEKGEWIDPNELEDEALGQLIETTNETKVDNEN